MERRPVLSPRMAAVAALVPAEGVVADIGTDHGRLAVWLALQGRKVVAMDVSAPSLQKARALSAIYGVESVLDCRVGDGLTPLSAGEASTAVMAGMGSPTMTAILSADPVKARGLDALIMQPMNAVELLRRWLRENGFAIDAEGFGRERGGVWPIFRARPGGESASGPYDDHTGSWELAAAHPLFGDYLRQEAGRRRFRLSRAAGGRGTAAVRRRRELTLELQIFEEAMAWLAQRKPS